MGRALQFEIVGDPSKGIDAFHKIEVELDKIGKHSGFAAMGKDVTSVAMAMDALRASAVAAGRAYKTMSGDMTGIGARSREVTSALKTQAAEVHKATNALAKQKSELTSVQTAAQGAARAAATLRAGFTAATAASTAMRSSLTGSSTVLTRMLTQASLLANRLAQGARSATLAARSGLGAASQGVQSLGIGFRMSGIAIGNQLANLGGGGLSGLLGGVAGAAAAGAEMGVRLVSALTGTAVRLLGAIGNMILVPLGSVVQGIAGLVKSTLAATLGSTASLVTQAAGNILSGITNLVGEMVNQVGNIFTGIAEAARGAFQGAVTIAGQMLGSLVGIAETVASKIGGALGTIGKMALGIGGTLGGFAFNDMMQTETGLKKGMVLLDDKLSPSDERALRSWFEDLHTKMPTLSRSVLGTTFQRVVSTGFGGDVEGAKGLTEQAAALAFAAGETDAAEGARVMAKSWSVFRDELEGFDKPFERIADLMFNVVKVGDVAMGDLVNHLGEVLAPAKAVGLSFEQLLTLIAKMSRTAGVEQTFTGLRRLLLEPLKMSKDAQALLSDKGINVFDLSDTEKASISAKQRAIVKAEAEIRDLEAAKDAAPEAARRARADQRVERKRLEIAKRKATGSAREAIQQQIDALDLQVAQYAPKQDFNAEIDAKKEALKSLKAEAKDLEGTLGSVTKDMPKFLKLIGERLNPREIEKVFPDIRAITAMFTLANQDPRIAADIEKQMSSLEHVVARAAETQADSVHVRLLRLWEGMKKPFATTLEQMRGPLTKFLDSAISGLKNLTVWWSKALVHPSLGRLLDNASGKVGGLLGGIFGGVEAPEQGKVWRAIGDGLDRVWSIGGKVATAFKTVGTAIAGVASESGTLISIWNGMKSAGSWLAETGKQLGGGDMTNVNDAISKTKGAFVTLYNSAAKAMEPIVQKAKDAYEWVIKAGKDLWSGVKTFFSSLSTGIKGMVPLLLAGASPGMFAGGLLGNAVGGGWGMAAGALSGGMIQKVLRGGSRAAASLALAGGGAVGAAGMGAGAGGGGGGGGYVGGGMAQTAGKGLLGYGSPFYTATVMNQLPTMRPVMPGAHLSVAQRRAIAIAQNNDGTRNGYRKIDSRNPPMHGPLMDGAWMAAGWQDTRGPMTRTPWAYGDMQGRPDLMGKKHDWLFPKRKGPIELTRSEGVAMFERMGRGGGGSPVGPMSQAEAHAYGPLSMRDRMGFGLQRAREGFGTFARSPLLGLAVGAVGAGMETYANDPTSRLGQSGTMVRHIGTGAATGAAIGSFIPVIGTTIGAFLGAVTGAITGFAAVTEAVNDAEAAFSEARGKRDESRVAASLEAGNAMRSGMSPSEAIKALEAERASIGKFYATSDGIGLSSEDSLRKRALDAQIRSTTTSGLGSLYGGMAGGDHSKEALDEFGALYARAKGMPSSNGVGTLADDFASSRNMSPAAVEGNLAKWRSEVDAAAAASAKAAAADAVKAAAIEEVNERLGSLSTYLAAAEDALGEFAGGDVSMRPSDRAKDFAKYANNLTAAADTLLTSIDSLPEGSDEAAKALYEASVSARRFASTLSDAVKEAEGISANAPSAQEIVDTTPGLKAIFGDRLPDSADVKAEASHEAQAKQAQQELIDAATAAANAVDDLGDSSASAASALSSLGGGGGGSGTLYPGAADLTVGEGRGRKKQIRQEDRRKRMLANTKIDEFGNQIDPFTGLPSVGEHGLGWGARMGDGDMGFNGKPSAASPKSAFNASGGNLSAFKSQVGKPVPSGSDGLATNSKKTADAAGDLVGPTKKAASNLGKAASDLNKVKANTEEGLDKTTALSKSTKDFVSSAATKIGALGASIEDLRNEIRAFDAIPVPSADSAGN